MRFDLKGKGRFAGAFSSAGLFCAFAFLALAVLLFGARSYRASAQRVEDNFSLRTASSYLANKVRQHDTKNSVRVGEFGGVPALRFLEVANGDEYITVIYFYDGALREILTVPDAVIDPAAGISIVEMNGMDVVQKDGGIQLNLQAGGQSAELFLSIRSGL